MKKKRMVEIEETFCDVDTVQAILGHQCLDHSKPYLTVDQETIRRAYELAL